MRITSRPMMAALTIAALVAPVLWSKASVAEEWPGTLKRQGKQRENITLVVEISDDGPVIKKMIYAGTPFEFKAQESTEAGLTFTWAPGDKDVKCALKKKNHDKYAGECQAEGSGSVIRMNITARDNDNTPQEKSDEQKHEGGDANTDEDGDRNGTKGKGEKKEKVARDESRRSQ